MTNILYFTQILRDDSSSSADTESEISEFDLELRNREKLAARGAVFSAIGKAYRAIARSVNLGSSSSGSTSEVKKEVEKQDDPLGDKINSGNPRLLRIIPQPRSFPNHVELVAAGWPFWLAAVAGDAIKGWVPRRADSFEKIDKIGQGKHSIVYKARDLVAGKLVAIKKVRFDTSEPEAVKFMAREILILRLLDHPNVMKLEGLVTSRMSASLYLVFEYMEHDLAGLAANPLIKFTEPQIKCYMHQLFVGLEHCHNHGVLHRDIKGSDLLVDNEGVLKIADFGLASLFGPHYKHPMTSQVVSLWYRPPELLLGASDYGVAVDLWSAGCVLAELLAGRPIMTGRTEVDQLHAIYKLCGSPSDEYWENIPHASLLKPRHPYKRCIAETFKNFPPSSISLIETLLAFDPSERQTAATALRSEFFSTKPYKCEPLSLPQYLPSKSLDAELHAETARRRSVVGLTNATDPRSRRHQATKVPHLAKSSGRELSSSHQGGSLAAPLGSSLVGPLVAPDNIGITHYSKNRPPLSPKKGLTSIWSAPLMDTVAIMESSEELSSTHQDGSLVEPLDSSQFDSLIAPDITGVTLNSLKNKATLTRKTGLASPLSAPLMDTDAIISSPRPIRQFLNNLVLCNLKGKARQTPRLVER